MRHTTRYAGILLGIGLLAHLPLPAQGAGEPINMFFAMPTAVDPVKLYLFTPGNPYSDTNDPNNRSNGPITGATLLPAASNGQGGLEIHGRFGSVAPLPVVELDFFTTFLGPLDLTPTQNQNIINGRTGLPFVPWLAVDQGIANNRHKFTLKPQSDSAPMNQGGYYGILSATVPSGVDDSAFRPAGFSFTGFAQAPTTPEPGVGALLLGAVLAGGRLAARRRKTGKSSLRLPLG